MSHWQVLTIWELLEIDKESMTVIPTAVLATFVLQALGMDGAGSLCITFDDLCRLEKAEATPAQANPAG